MLYCLLALIPLLLDYDENCYGFNLYFFVSSIEVCAADNLLIQAAFSVFQVINGLLERPDWEEAIRTPLGILPGGSANALAASVHYYSG